jgi:hypothetical protein
MKIRGFMDREVYLQSLLQQVHTTEPRTPARSRILNKLVREIQTFKGFLRDSHPRYPEAWNESLCIFCEKIDRFEAKRESIEISIRGFINAVLRNKIYDLYRRDGKEPRSLEDPFPGSDGDWTLLDVIPETNGFGVPLSLLDQLILQQQAQQRQQLALRMAEYVHMDPDSRLRNCRLRKCPEIHAQMLTLRLLLKEPPDRMLHISKEYGVNNPTITQQWQRLCLPLLKKIACELMEEGTDR